MHRSRNTILAFDAQELTRTHFDGQDLHVVWPATYVVDGIGLTESTLLHHQTYRANIQNNPPAQRPHPETTGRGQSRPLYELRDSAGVEVIESLSMADWRTPGHTVGRKHT